MYRKIIFLYVTKSPFVVYCLMVSEKILAPFFPFWNEIAPADGRILAAHTSEKTYPQGKIIYLPSVGQSCLGLILVRQGGFRAHIVSGEGRELTLYRLSPGDICLFSASCIMQNIAFDFLLEAEQETAVYQITPEVFERVMEKSVPVSRFINSLMAERFSSVMRTLERTLFRGMDSRIAEWLLKEAGGGIVKTTHAEIAKNLGSAREVVTRILGFFEEKDLVALARGRIIIKNPEALKKLASNSASL